jgi:protein AbiQ
MSLSWKVVNDDYLDYLRQIEKRIPFTEYGDDKYKPFFGVLFEKDNLLYITQISSIKQRHYKMKNNIDFYKIYHPDDGRLLAVVNLNYMFPIPKTELYDLYYKDIEKYRTFKNDIDKSKYIDILRKELKEINKLNLSSNALQIYEDKKKYPDSDVSKRCFDFNFLEKLANEWIAKNMVNEQIASTKEAE